MYYYKQVGQSWIAVEARNKKEAARLLGTQEVTECRRLASTRVQSEKILNARSIWDGNVRWLSD